MELGSSECESANDMDAEQLVTAHCTSAQPSWGGSAPATAKADRLAAERLRKKRHRARAEKTTEERAVIYMPFCTCARCRHQACTAAPSCLRKVRTYNIIWNLTKLNGVNTILRKWRVSAHCYFRSSLLHVINGARVVHALQSTLAAVCFAAVRLAAVCFAASPQRGFFFPFLFLRPLGVKGWCRLYPPGALEVGVNTLVTSREGSREAGSDVGSRVIA